MENFPTVGEKIKLIRKQYKLTQIEFAQSVDISQGNLSEIESGNAKPSFDVLILLASKHSVDMNWLIQNRNTELHFGFNNDELNLIENYRKLEDVAKEELLDYTNLKLKRYQRKGSTFNV